MQPALRVALFGSGRISEIHGHNIANHPQLELAVVCSRNPESARRLAGRYGAEAVTSSSDVFTDDTVDAVVIGSPNSTHINLMLQAARHGIAALCEKPIDLDLDRVRASWQEINDANTPLMLAFNRRYDRSFAAVHARTAAGEIGRLEQLTITSRDPAPSPKEYVTTSGGIFRDMTIHDLDMARFFVPDIIEVHALGANAFSDYTREAGDFDSAVTTLRGSGDELITIINSRHSAYGYDQRLEAFGSQGMLLVDNTRPTTVRAFTATATSAQDPSATQFLDRYDDSYRLELDAFVTAVQSGTPCSPGYLDGMRALELAYAAAESASTGCSVRLPSNSQ
jgi:myo-inositol 2-dehydrogenase/D-chiro-inositol 1-dehydrogenase